MHSTGGMRWTLPLLLIGGCALDEHVTSVEEPLLCANPLICPGNSDLLALLGVFELNTDLVTDNARGFHMVSIAHDGVNVPTFQVPGAKIHEVDANNYVHEGAGAIGTSIHVHHTPTNQDFELKIINYITVPFYDVTVIPKIIGYDIIYRNISTRGPWLPMCPFAEINDDAGIAATWAVFWKGDRYDPDTGVITASGLAVGSWFNISCAGEAWVKVERAQRGGAVAPFSSVTSRQMTLWMFTATYCTPGIRHTHLGMLIDWKDPCEPRTYAATAVPEAVWDANGATCLSKPRFEWPTGSECHLDPCTPAQLALGNLVSANP